MKNKNKKLKSKVKRPESIYTNDGGIPFVITLIVFLTISVILMFFIKYK
jgi:hypothetical protein